MKAYPCGQSPRPAVGSSPADRWVLPPRMVTFFVHPHHPTSLWCFCLRVVSRPSVLRPLSARRGPCGSPLRPPTAPHSFCRGLRPSCAETRPRTRRGGRGRRSLPELGRGKLEPYAQPLGLCDVGMLRTCGSQPCGGQCRPLSPCEGLARQRASFDFRQPCTSAFIAIKVVYPLRL